MTWVAWILVAALVLLLLVAVMVVLLALTILSSAPWVPTHRAVAQEMCNLAKLKEGDRVLDLGCGDGAILIVAAREFGAVGMGIELNPFLALWARVRARLAGVSDRVTIIRGNMFTADLPDVDVAMLYLLPRAMCRVELRLQKRYSPLRVVSNGFEFGSIKPTSTTHVQDATLRVYSW